MRRDTTVLTKREVELHELLMSDLYAKEIAHKMGVSENCCKAACKRLYDKLYAKGGRIELMAREIARLRSKT